jgi:ABC-type polysaccharide/polyol phosphate export permease
MSVESVEHLDIAAHSAAAQPFFTSDQTPKQLAFQDLKDGLARWRIWLLLAYQDIKLRYRRSSLGPFWITISMAITVYSMGFLYGHLFRTELHRYFPFLAAGLLSWTLISTAISDLTDGFTASDGLIKQIKLPYTLYIHRVVARNIIIFFHNLVVMIPIIIIFHKTVGLNLSSLLLIPNLFLIYINAACYGMILALIGARYRDIPPIIRSLIQVIFFVTPVIWDPLILPQKYQYLAYLNPFYSFVELIRAPLLGITPSLNIYVISFLMTVIGIIFSSALFIKYRSRIVYWV